MVRLFRKKYPNPTAPIWMYGDATGRGRDVQTGQTDYDLIESEMRGYPVSIEMKVPLNNPFIKDRLNALNRRLKGPEGEIGLFVDPDKCPNLVMDFMQCVLDKKQAGLHKVRDTNDPYHERSHALDDISYLCNSEWPISDESWEREYAEARKKRPKERTYGRILGAI